MLSLQALPQPHSEKTLLNLPCGADLGARRKLEILYFTSTEKLFVFAELYLKNGFFPNLGYKAFEDGAEDELFFFKKGENKNDIQFDFLEFNSLILALYLLVL